MALANSQNRKLLFAENKSMRITLFLVALAFAGGTPAQVYKWVAPDGSVHFSDQPQPGAEKITLPTFPPPQPQRYPLVPPTMPEAESTPEAYKYKGLTITKPEPGETVLNNQGNVEVSVTIDPKLNTDEDHKIQLLLDGRAHRQPSASLDQALRGLNRGPHKVAAQVIDERGKVLITSRPVGFYLRISSPLFHPPTPGTPPVGVQQAPRAPMAPRAPRAPHAPFRPAQLPPPVPAQ